MTSNRVAEEDPTERIFFQCLRQEEKSKTIIFSIIWTLQAPWFSVLVIWQIWTFWIFLAIFFFFFVHSHCNGQNHHFLVWNLNLWKSFVSLQKIYNIIQLQNMVSLYLKGHETCYEYKGFMHVYDNCHLLNYVIFNTNMTLFEMSLL